MTYGKLNFNVWDLGGQTSIRPYWRCYYANTAAVIFVVDSTDIERLQTAADELAAMLNEDELKDAALLVFANKQDQPGAKGAADISQALRLGELRDRNWSIMACSAVEGSGITEGMDWLSVSCRRRDVQNNLRTERILTRRSKPYHRIRRTSGFETQDRVVSVHDKYTSYIIPAALGYWAKWPISRRCGGNLPRLMDDISCEGAGCIGTGAQRLRYVGTQLRTFNPRTGRLHGAGVMFINFGVLPGQLPCSR